MLPRNIDALWRDGAEVEHKFCSSILVELDFEKLKMRTLQPSHIPKGKAEAHLLAPLFFFGK